MDSKEIRELFAKHELPLGRKDIWEVKGKPVILHSALERLSAHLGITWDPPLVAKSTDTEVVILARGTRKDGISEWSYGEVNTAKGDGEGGNYLLKGKQPGYPWAMSEKRAKDRVIIKLAGMHGAYSEEEAEDFAARNADKAGSTGAAGRGSEDEGRDETEEKPVEKPVEKPHERRPDPETDNDTSEPEKPVSEPDNGAETDSGEPEGAKALRQAIAKSRTTKAVTELMLKKETQELLGSVNDKLRESLREAGKARLKALGWPGSGEKAA